MHFTASKIEALQQETDNIFNVLKILVYRKIDNIFEIDIKYWKERSIHLNDETKLSNIGLIIFRCYERNNT